MKFLFFIFILTSFCTVQSKENVLRKKIIDEYLSINEAPKKWKEQCKSLDELAIELGILIPKMENAIYYSWFPTTSAEVKKTIDLLEKAPHPDSEWNNFIMRLSNLKENEISQLLGVEKEMPSFWTGCTVALVAATGLARGVIQRKITGVHKKMAIKSFVQYFKKDENFWYQLNFVSDFFKVTKELSYFHYIAKSSSIDSLITKALAEAKRLNSNASSDGSLSMPGPELFLNFLRDLKVMKDIDIHRRQIIKILYDFYSTN